MMDAPSVLAFTSSLLRLDLRNQRQQAAAGLVKERQPLLHAVGVLVDHVRRAGEGDASTFELLLSCVDVRDTEVQDGVVVKVGHFDDRPILDHQTNSAEIEKRQLSCREQMREPKNVAVKPLGLRQISDGGRAVLP